MTRFRMTSGRPRVRLHSAHVVLAAAAVLGGCDEQVVAAARAATVEVVPAEITLQQGDQATASAVARERGGRELPGRPVTWSVEDPGIATVSSAGLVEGQAPGTTVLQADIEGVVGVATITVLAAQSPPEAGDCEYRNRTIASDVVIPEGTSCTFTDVRVRGDLKLRRGSTVVATNLRVDGAIEAKAASRLTLISSRVDDDIEFEDGGSVLVRQTLIDGNLLLESNNGTLEVQNNTVEGNVQVYRNRGGPFTISDNRIEGNLQCRENDPSPTGGGNDVDGNKEDQCRSL
jgi:hypothetical protein